MQRLRLLASVSLLCLLAPGCITINTFGRGEEPLVETVVHGERGPKVLLLDVDGLISDVSVEGPLGFGERESSVARVREQLDKARGDSEVRAVLLRINSPGGSVTASDVLYREVRAFKEERQVPVVAQLMGVAASGGYYVAMAADVVLAHPTTITGSIGVISAGVNVSGLMQRYGVTDQTLVGGGMKDAGSPLRPMTAEERSYLQAVIDDLHERFRAVVSEGRPALGDARVRAISDGRIFTAKQAERAGLVDGIGYLPGAIDELERRVGAPEVRVVAYHRDREWRSNLYSTAPAGPSTQANPAARLGLGGGPAFLYLWWPGGL